MKFVIQRVNNASVTIDEKIVGKINKGFLVFIGVSNDDTKEFTYKNDILSFTASMQGVSKVVELKKQ